MDIIEYNSFLPESALQHSNSVKQYKQTKEQLQTVRPTKSQNKICNTQMLEHEQNEQRQNKKELSNVLQQNSMFVSQEKQQQSADSEKSPKQKYMLTIDEALKILELSDQQTLIQQNNKLDWQIHDILTNQNQYQYSDFKFGPQNQNQTVEPIVQSPSEKVNFIKEIRCKRNMKKPKSDNQHYIDSYDQQNQNIHQNQNAKEEISLEITQKPANTQQQQINDNDLTDIRIKRGMQQITYSQILEKQKTELCSENEKLQMALQQQVVESNIIQAQKATITINQQIDDLKDAIDKNKKQLNCAVSSSKCQQPSVVSNIEAKESVVVEAQQTNDEIVKQKRIPVSSQAGTVFADRVMQIEEAYKTRIEQIRMERINNIDVALPISQWTPGMPLSEIIQETLRIPIKSTDQILNGDCNPDSKPQQELAAQKEVSAAKQPQVPVPVQNSAPAATPPVKEPQKTAVPQQPTSTAQTELKAAPAKITSPAPVQPPGISLAPQRPAVPVSSPQIPGIPKIPAGPPKIGGPPPIIPKK